MPPSSGAIKKAQELLRMGLAESAEDVMAEAARKHPRDPDTAYFHGMVLTQRGKAQAGIDELTRATKLRPGEPAILVALGNALMMTEQAQAAAQRHREALRSQPRGPMAGPAKIGLTLALVRMHCLEEAVEIGREAVALMPDAMQAWGNHYSSLRDSGRIEEGLTALREATRRLPREAALLSHLIAGLNYSSASDPAEGRALADRFGVLMGPEGRYAFTNPRDPERPLRIALLSNDLRTHSVAFFVEPILRGLDRQRCSVTIYSTAPTRSGGEDPISLRLRELADQWHEVSGVASDDLVRRIRADAIDVLLELNGHTHGHRLDALARRAAPVQATYLGYPGTTGIPAIDARFVDAITDPPGSEPWASELLVRLPGCFLCYAPLVDAGEVTPAPSLATGHVTFGSFNSMPKLTPEVLKTWARVLSAAASSTLLLKNRAMADPRVAARVRGELSALGVAPDRVEAAGHRPTQAEHLREYARVDIALDTFPYNGTTTTCEALWMGVPVVSVMGRTHAGRVGASLLSCVGLGELVARDADEYVTIATGLAGDVGRRASLRGSLRERMRGSPLMDAQAFARGFEGAIRSLWRNWCERGSARVGPTA
jgi:protein O-GlcNAc transferase